MFCVLFFVVLKRFFGFIWWQLLSVFNAGLPRPLKNPAKFWNFYWKISGSGKSWSLDSPGLRSFSRLENDLSPGESWNLIGSDLNGSFWLQIDMFLQTKKS